MSNSQLLARFERDGFLSIENFFAADQMDELDQVIRRYCAVPTGTPDDITDVCIYRNMRYRFSTSEVIEERIAG